MNSPGITLISLVDRLIYGYRQNECANGRAVGNGMGQLVGGEWFKVTQQDFVWHKNKEPQQGDLRYF